MSKRRIFWIVWYVGLFVWTSFWGIKAMFFGGQTNWVGGFCFAMAGDAIFGNAGYYRIRGLKTPEEEEKEKANHVVVSLGFESSSGGSAS
jgi:hypothetical protein